MTETLSFSEVDLVRSLCKESFFHFVQEFWSVIIPERPIWNWHIEYICSEVQKLVEGAIEGKRKPYDLVINVPPGSTKSTIVSVMLPIWAWVKHPPFRTIVATHTAVPLGLDLSLKSRRIAESDRFRAIFPEVELTEDQNTKNYFMNSSGGSRLVATVGGHSPIGLHGHLLIVDDPIDPKTARKLSTAAVEEANRWIAEDLQSRKIDASSVPMILIMQRLCVGDPTDFWLETGGSVRHIKLPADLDGYEVLPAELEHRYVDGLLDPVRLPRHVLDDIKLRGELTYAAQYGQAPTPPTGGLFKVDRMPVSDTFPEGIRKAVRYWDKASTAGGGGSYTAGVLLGIDKRGKLWVLDVVRGRWEVDEREEVIQTTAAKDASLLGNKCRYVIGIEQEPGSGGKESAIYTVRNLSGYVVKVNPAAGSGDKVLRAEPFAAQVNVGNVHIVKGAWNRHYKEELGVFPFGKHDDQVDASSGAFSVLTKGGINRLRATLDDWLEVAF